MIKGNFQDLAKRLIFSSLSILCVIFLLVFAMAPWVKLGLSLLLAVVAGVGVWEYIHLVKIPPRKLFQSLLIGFAVALVLSIYVALTFIGFTSLPWGIFFVGAFLLFLYHFNKIEGALSNIATGFFGICYVAVPIGLLLLILYSQTGSFKYEDGRLWIAYLVIVAKVTDIAGYFGGKLWGVKKLSPALSPNKTVVGAICGFFGAIVLSVIFYLIIKAFSVSGFNLSLVESIWLGAFIGIVSQCGDLAESLLKRDKGVKDSNRLPGLGGILDMLDSLLFTIPILYLFILMHR